MKKRVKLNYRNIFRCAVILFLLVLALVIFTKHITNIYIIGNNYYKDQEIINLAKIEDYPLSFLNSSKLIEKRLEKNEYISSAKVYKKGLGKVYIEVKENYPLFYNSSLKKTILYNNKEIKDELICPYIVNYIPDDLYKTFKEKFKKIDSNILYRISEIKYDPNDVDKERFYLTMADGNYIYITLDKMLTLNKYKEMLQKFQNKKGILYLDSGEYFKIMES